LDSYYPVLLTWEGRLYATDEIKIQAGPLTGVIWAFAHLFYRHRQRRWKVLLHSKIPGYQMNHSATWKPLFCTGVVAALSAALLFRRNIGAEVSLFTGIESIPTSAADWFSLLQSNLFVGLSYLAVFDLAYYFLVGIVFMALAAMLWQQYAASDEAQGAALLAAGQALLASSGAMSNFPGTGTYMSYLLIARILFQRWKES
jgi:hypothetical protein